MVRRRGHISPLNKHRETSEATNSAGSSSGNTNEAVTTEEEENSSVFSEDNNDLRQPPPTEQRRPISPTGPLTPPPSPPRPEYNRPKHRGRSTEEKGIKEKGSSEAVNMRNVVPEVPPDALVSPEPGARSSAAETEDGHQDNSIADVSVDSATGEPRVERVVEDLLEVQIPAPPKPIMANDGTGSRLIITQIVNENFKSYYGKHVLGPFHKNFTSIVGPNGSGKSNVIDSLLFVFGYRAQRIRSKKVGVLIHNSQVHEDVDSCTVEIHFRSIIDKPDNEEEFDAVPNSKFVVSRTAFKDNSSYYQVDGKRTQFKEVKKLLAEKGIDLVHNRFLILQGEVEQIALMKPKAQQENEEGMLEYLEDIIGSSRLKNPIEQLCQKVDELNELRTEKVNRVKAAEKEKDELEGPKNEAIEFLEQENEMVRWKSKLYQFYRMKVCGNLKNVIERRDQIVAEYEQKIKEIEAVSAKVTEYNDKKKKLVKQCEQKGQEADSFHQKFQDLNKRDVKLKEDIKNKKVKRARLVKNLDDERNKLAKEKEKPSKLEKEIEDHNSIIARSQEKIAELEGRLEEAMKEVGPATKKLQEEKDKKEEILSKHTDSVNEAKGNLDLKQSEFDMYMRNRNTELRKLEEIKSKRQKDLEELDNKKTQLEAADRHLPHLEKEHRQWSEKVTSFEKEEARLAKEVSEKNTKGTEARANMTQAKSKGKVLDALLQQRNKGKIQGIFGRLGDLGAIDEKYDVAIRNHP